jgi:hypothetical protein
MRLVPLRVAVYVAMFALPAVAQQPTRISDEMPHAELAVGAGGMALGPGRDLERTMTELGLASRLGKFVYPYTEPPNIVPGVFAEFHVGVGPHAMVGLFVGADQTTTSGRSPAGASLLARADVKTRALLASYRPTPWLRLGAGPALLDRQLTFERTNQTFGGTDVGWVANGEAKFVRRQMTAEHPAVFGLATVQYRDSPALSVPALSLPLYGSDHRYAAWPAQPVRMSHWMIGLGFGFEI